MLALALALSLSVALNANAPPATRGAMAEAMHAVGYLARAAQPVPAYGYYRPLHAATIAQSPCAGMGALDRFADCTLFASPQEAANTSAHIAWSLAVPLAGRAAFGPKGTYIAGGGWLAYSLINEFALHGPEDARERALNLTSRLIPCAVVMLWEALR